MLYLYTENFFLFPRLKNVTKRLLGRGSRGPQGVLRSLQHGLAELDEDFLVDSDIAAPVETVCVVSGHRTLRWAVEMKKNGYIQRLIAGPNVALPLEADGIIFHPAIDLFLVPSSWVGDYCDTFRPGFRQKVRVWAAGVETVDLPREQNARTGCLVYQKNAPKEVFDAVVAHLRTTGVPYTVFHYGKYRRGDYIRELSRARFEVFLSRSESQGIALHEAWMMDVPTLVYNGSHLKNSRYEYDKSSPAPYLVPQAGLLFDSSQGFAVALSEFFRREHDFYARRYHLENFTDKICARKFLEILN